MLFKRRLLGISMAVIMLVSLCAVCASTGVTAATDSRSTQPSAEQSTADVVSDFPPGGLMTTPAVASWGSGRLDVFAVGYDDHLWHKWFSGGAWHGWQDLGTPEGGSFNREGSPTVCSWGANRLDVFVQGWHGGTSTLWHKWWDGSSWGVNRWEDMLITKPLPAGVEQLMWDSTPAACSWGANRIDVFATCYDPSFSLYQLWFDGTWHWYRVGGDPATYVHIAGSPGAISTKSWGYNRVDVVVRGSDGYLYQKWFSSKAGGWQPWFKLDTGTTKAIPSSQSWLGWPYFLFDLYAPSLTSSGKNRLDVFFVDTDGHLQQKWFNGAWQPLYPLGGLLTSSPSAVAWQDSTTRIDIFTRGDNDALWQKYFASGYGWFGWYNLGYIAYGV